MMLPKVHEGNYLVCHTLREATTFMGPTVPVEDLNGEVELLSLYNFRTDVSDASWLPIGTIMVIKEPYLKKGSQSNDIIVRVDSPSDVIFVGETDKKMLEV